MKKIMAAVFCMLLAGSTLVQSCKKPDAAITPDPITPVLPVDSTKAEVPVVLLTEQQIIQRAIEKLDTGTFEFYSGYRTIQSKLRLSSPPFGIYFYTDDGTNGKVELLPNIFTPIGTFKRGQSIIEASSYTYEGAKNFYNKIFVNEIGDSFLGGIYSTLAFSQHTNRELMLPSDTTNANSFQNLLGLLNTPIDSGSFVNRYYKKLFVGNPSQIQYYFNKDSLVLSYISGNAITEKDDTFTIQHDYLRIRTSKAIRRK